MKKAVIVFSGFNPRAVIAFLRTLESNGIKYGIVAKSNEDEVFLTSYSKNVLSVRKKLELDLEDLKSTILRLQNKLTAESYILAPSTEALNRFMIDNRQEFENLNCEIPLVSKEVYERISDKHSFGELCKEHGISVPQEFDVIKTDKSSFVAKPKKYFSRGMEVYAPVLVFSRKEKQEFLESHEVSDFYYQEYITGESLYLLYYFYKDGDVLKFSQRNLVQQPDGKSIIAAESADFHLTDESRKYEELFRSLSFFGLVMVEIKQTEKGKNYMIEANPRFWGPSQLFVDAGINLFEALLYDLEVLESKPTLKTQQTGTRYFWGGGMEHNGQILDVVFHNIGKKEFMKDYPKWLASDIYNRQDTEELYKQEIGER